MQPAFDERLTAPRTWWLVSALAGVAAGLIVLPLGLLPALGAVVAAGTLAAVLTSVYGAARIRVVADSLVAGRARIPLSALGEAQALAPDEARAWRGPRADPRAFMLLRSYIRTAVRVEVTDPADPTPYLYLSSRRPERLVQALRKAGKEVTGG